MFTSTKPENTSNSLSLAGGLPIEIIPASLLSLIAIVLFYVTWGEIQLPGVEKSFNGCELANGSALLYVVPVYCLCVAILNVMLDIGRLQLASLKKVTFCGAGLVALVLLYTLFQWQEITGLELAFGFYAEVMSLIGIVIAVAKMKAGLIF